MVVYDVTNKQSFSSCSKWIERIKAKKATPESPLPGTKVNKLASKNTKRYHRSAPRNIIIKPSGVLVANKVDLKGRRVVTEEEGRKFASSKDLKYFECSAVSQCMLW